MYNDENLEGDKDGLRVTNYKKVAEHVSQRLRESMGDKPALDVCCGIGGTTLEMAKVFSNVHAVDIATKRINCARKNLERANLINKVTLHNEDIYSLRLNKILRRNQISLIHTDVEWTTSGIYGQDWAINLSQTNPPMDKLFHFLKANYTDNICMRLPKTISEEKIRVLGKCEIEKIYKDDALKFTYSYFGKLRNKEESSFRF